MTPIAPTLQGFFTDRLIKQLHASPRTIASYRDSLRLLLCFANDRTGIAPAALGWDDLDEPLITAFLDHLETDRHNCARTRNLRLTAIRALFRYAALRHPEHAAVIARVLSIPAKRFDRRIVAFLTAEESAALIDAAPEDRWEGRRDRAMLTLALHAGLRVSELIAVNSADIQLGTGEHVRVEGKGRKQRAVPLTKDAQAVLAAWLDERAGLPDNPMFPTRTGRRLTRDAVERRVATHAATAAQRCPSLAGKRVHPHTLRHSCAMSLLQARVDSTVIALWLGHAVAQHLGRARRLDVRHLVQQTSQHRLQRIEHRPRRRPRIPRRLARPDQPVDRVATDPQPPRDLTLLDPIRMHRPHLSPIHRAAHLLCLLVDDRSTMKANTETTDRDPARWLSFRSLEVAHYWAPGVSALVAHNADPTREPGETEDARHELPRILGAFSRRALYCAPAPGEDRGQWTLSFRRAVVEADIERGCL
jgi:site-specific recombinase XerD